MMKLRTLAISAFAAGAVLIGSPVFATLAPGKKAPEFTAAGARAGQAISVDLHKALENGPVVLYFFPAAFTPGCNMEAHAFAEKMPEFRAAGATVIGLTAGNTDQLKKFSAEKCAGQFTVAAATPAIVKAYDVSLTKPDGTATGYTQRTTYVIARDGKIVDEYTNMSPMGHIERSLAAVRKLAKG